MKLRTIVVSFFSFTIMWTRSKKPIVAIAWTTTARTQNFATLSSPATGTTTTMDTSTKRLKTHTSTAKSITINTNSLSPIWYRSGGLYCDTVSRYFSTPRYVDEDDDDDDNTIIDDVAFQRGDKIQVEVVQFGPLGASVEVIGLGHGDDVPLLPPDAKQPYGSGLVIQKEIQYFREARNYVDVVQGEILPAYVQNVREEDGKLDVTLRSYGGKAKSTEIGFLILERLNNMPDGRLNIGERSSPAEISAEFPGVSKSVFKKVGSGKRKTTNMCFVWCMLPCDLIAASFFFSICVFSLRRL